MTIQGKSLGQLLQEKLAESKPTTLNEMVKETQERMKMEDKVSVSGVPYLVPGQRIDIDAVNSPPHYTKGGIETIDYMEAKSTTEEFRGHLRLTALKYLSRAGYKDDIIKDLKKAQWYLNRLVSTYGEQNENKF